MSGLVVHLFLTGAQAVTVEHVDDGTLISASVLSEPGGRCMARIVAPVGEMWALVTALSQALTDHTGQSSTAMHPVTIVVEPVHSGEPPDT